jgi:regulatory protein
MGELSEEEAQQKAVELAYRALAQRERTVAELRDRLESKGVEPDAIDHAVAELKAAGFLDDERFAQRFAEDKRELESWGAERIARDLRRRGVPEGIIDAVSAARGAGDELQNALELLAQRVPEPPADDRERDRAWRMLVRKGYAPELAYDAVRTHSARRAA